MFVKGARLQGASPRDRERFEIERTILDLAADVAGTPTVIGCSACHWMLLATTWVDGEPLTELHPPSLLDTFANIVDEVSSCVQAPWATLPTLADVLRAKQPLIEHGLTWLESAAAEAGRNYLEAAPYQPGSLQHGGLWPDNLLCGPNQPAVVDWASSVWGPQSWDQATLVLLAGQSLAPEPASIDAPTGAIVVRAILAAHTITENSRRTPLLARELLADASTWRARYPCGKQPPDNLSGRR
ncbi:Phosphotransferase enzyme family protein [Mycobacterium lentiflavum]|uniref:Phosphotransferase enzyme family protein n=2 Tax=Mycobacterium lentiflavum TaxID=141349 RepID=A0A0E4H229_MYCLN|nr:Phosphotransferase enzyme family protein [Mycobacterium lentiflavum]